MVQSGSTSSDARIVSGQFGRRRTRSHAAGERLLARAIDAARRGDRDGLRYLYVRYVDDVYGYARSIVRDEHEAEDVAQQVFTKLMTSLDKYEPRSVPFSAWILRVTHNLAIDHLRGRRAVPSEDVSEMIAAGGCADANLTQCIHQAFDQLPDEQRKVLVMRHVVGLSPGEIAERLGKTEGSIHGLHHRGRGALKAALVELDAVPVTA